MLLNNSEGRLDKDYLTTLREQVSGEKNPVTYLAVDPGKANGVCGYGAEYNLMFMYTIKADDMIMFLQQFRKTQKIIVEDFKLYPNKAKQQTYSDMETSRVIGRIESWAELFDVEVVKQGALIKATGYKWIGEKPYPKSNPLNHQVDAHVHFMYWAIKNGHISAASLVRKER